MLDRGTFGWSSKAFCYSVRCLGNASILSGWIAWVLVHPEPLPNRLKMPAVRTYKRHFRPTPHAVLADLIIPLDQNCMKLSSTMFNIQHWIKIYQNTWISWIIIQNISTGFASTSMAFDFQQLCLDTQCIELCEVLQKQKINTLERLAKLTDGQCRPWELSNNFRSGCTLLHLDQKSNPCTVIGNPGAGVLCIGLIET